MTLSARVSNDKDGEIKEIEWGTEEESAAAAAATVVAVAETPLSANNDETKDSRDLQQESVGDSDDDSPQSQSQSQSQSQPNPSLPKTDHAEPETPESPTSSSVSSSTPGFLEWLSEVIPPQYRSEKRLESLRFYARATAGLLGAVFVCNPLLVLRTIWEIVWRIVGTGLGIGVGAGLALHVFQQLQKWQAEHDREQQHKTKLLALSQRQLILEERIAASRRRQLRHKASLSTRALTLGDTTSNNSNSSSNSNNNNNNGNGNGNDHASTNHATSHAHHESHSSLFSPASSIGDAVAVGAEDGDSYVGLMAQAGYPFHDRIVRGQVLRGDHEFWNVVYRFTDEQIPRQLGVLLVTEEWQALPRAVTRELGRFLEHVMRDFVSSWYSLLDPGVTFRIEQEKRDEGILRDGMGRADSASGQKGSEKPDSQKQPPPPPLPPPPRKQMVFSTLTHRRAPMVDCCYKMMSSVLGNLATRAEHVNLLELVLLKWTQVLGQTLNEYRTLRRAAAEKRRTAGDHRSPRRSSGEGRGITSPRSSSSSSSSVSKGSSSGSKSSSKSTAVLQPPPSEVEVTREFLLAGKLHRAITFGLDVPSLLFADASGEECGLGVQIGVGGGGGGGGTNGNSKEKTTHAAAAVAAATATKSHDPTRVLEHRLYHTSILDECQVDYNRVLANRLVRALMPKSETNSQCVVAMLTEIIGSAVLTPVYNLGVPNFLNEVIVALLTADAAANATAKTKTKTKTNATAGPTANANANANANAPREEGSEPSRDGATSNDNPQSDATATGAADSTMARVPMDSNHPSETDEFLANDTTQSFDETSGVREEGKIRCVPDASSDSNAGAESASPKGSSAATEERQASQGETISSSKSNSNSNTATSAPSKSDLQSPKQDAPNRGGNRDPTTGTKTNGYKLLKLSAMALKDLDQNTRFDQARRGQQSPAYETPKTLEAVDWDDANCQQSALKVALVVEAALLDGRCAYNETKKEVFPDLLGGENDNNDEPPVANSQAPGSIDPATAAVATSDANESNQDGMSEWILSRANHSISDLFIEMASDMDAFEEQVVRCEMVVAAQSNGSTASSLVPRHDRTSYDFEPDVNEVATLRTLICTWLHTGHLFRAVRLISKAVDTVFAPYYARDAFLLMQDQRDIFTKQLQRLDRVEIMVDTMTVRVFPRLVVSEEFDLLVSAVAETDAAKAKTVAAAKSPSKSDANHHPAGSKDNNPVAVSDSYQYYGHQCTPMYLDFQRNEAFAASLRAERKRRWRAWETRTMEKEVLTVIRKTASHRDYELHSEMQNLSRLFYNGTAIMTVRDANRKKEKAEVKVSLLTVEIVSGRRRIEVPDDDSSFLLRAQSRQLHPVSVHLDDRNHDMGYKCFLATYEEPALSQGSSRYSDGRYIRRCFLQYYPSDRTARIVPQNDARKLDKRKEFGGNDHSGENHASSSFSRGFLNQRYLCQKVGATQSFMSSSLMEPTDFNANPRTGKALDFVYRMSLFDRPIVDLAGKQFTIQDSSSRGVHRADASSFEVTDATLSYVLLKIGKDLGSSKHDERKDGKAAGGFRNVETGPDGYPVLFLRFTKPGDQSGMEFKPYRLSFVRAALMVTSARQEAQLDTLIECVKAGSAKSATKARTEERLRPVKKILYFANDRSDHSFNQDLKLGQFLDRGQLQRNGLLNLRHPTSILHLDAKVEGTALAKEVPLASASTKSYNPDTVLYKIRCTAVVELVDNKETATDIEPYALDDGSYARFYREEFVVHRSMTEFQTLHKQLKSQVAMTESTMSTGNRIVGVASAALGSQNLNRRNKKVLIPSLAQASKIGALGITKKSIIKRMELLDEYIGYLLASNSLMNRCSELLLFLGASHPFPPEVTMTKSRGNIRDLLGRTNFVRGIALKDAVGTKLKMKNSTMGRPRSRSTSDKALSERTIENTKEPAETVRMDPIILNKVDQIPLAEVRNRILELIRLSFSFENASFMRSQLLAALETASFLAVAKQSDFRRVLHDLHVTHLSGEAIGGIIQKLLDILWPDGVFMKATPPLTQEEEIVLRDTARKKLHERFPDQVRALLGKDMTEEGLNMIHEMLQNRVIVKSLFYMLLDLLWIEVFPELRDTLPCASALDLDLL